MNDFISLLLSALIQLIVFSIIPLIWWLNTSKDINFFSWIGIKKPSFNESIIKNIVIIVCVAALYIVAMYFIMSNMMTSTQTATSQFSGKGIKAIPAILIYAIVQTGLSEEIFFRGFLCKRLTKRFGFVIGNVLQSLCFGLLHGLPFGIATGDFRIVILLTILPGIIGYIQGWMNEKKADGSIIPSWTLHSLMNVLSALSMI